MANEIKTKGAVVNWKTVAIGEIKSVVESANPNVKIPIGSFADTFVAYRLAEGDLPEYTFEVNMNPDDATQSTIETDWIAGTSGAVKILFATGTLKAINFTGFITNFTRGAENKGIWTAVITIQATTRPTRDAA